MGIGSEVTVQTCPPRCRIVEHQKTINQLPQQHTLEKNLGKQKTLTRQSNKIGEDDTPSIHMN